MKKKKNKFESLFSLPNYYYTGIKLNANGLTIATAATLFHRFMRESSPQGYDPYVNIQIFIILESNKGFPSNNY